MADDAIEVEFELTVDDLVAFNAYACKRLSKKCRACTFITYTSVFVFSFFSVVYFNQYVPVILSFFLGSLFIGLFYIFYSKNSYKRFYQSSDYQNAYIFDQKKCVVSIHGLKEEAERFHSIMKWTMFLSVEHVNGYIYLFVAPHYAFIIPKRAFADEAAFERFYEKCLEYWNAAKGREPAAEGAA